MQKFLVKLYLWGFFWVFFWEIDLNGIYSTVPKSIGCPRNPQYPFGDAGKAFRHALNYLCKG
jgi:hypothetical protein